MSSVFILLGITLLGVYYFAVASKNARQLNYIARYDFPESIRSKLLKKHPRLTEQQADRVFIGLKDYFRICHKAKKRRVAMPSQIVDDAWHEFILFTRSYDRFCGKAFARFLHHTPAEAMRRPTQAQEGIKRAWRLACALERINPKSPERLPLLFAIDGLLQIENGFIYRVDCLAAMANTPPGAYCASHIGCSSGCGGDAGTESGSSDSLDDGCSGSCSGGCGGD